jgi:hypothetical protein
MSIFHSDVPTSWIAVHDTLRDLAEAQRGVVTFSSPTVPPEDWPRTTGCDALAIVSVFDAAVHAYVTGELAERWASETDQLARATLACIEDTYAGNRSLWATLRAVAGALDQAAAPLPDPRHWQAAVHELMGEDDPIVGVAPVDHMVAVQFPSVEDWEEMAKLQLRFFWIVRGADRIDGPLVDQIPRTTNADALQLATYWTEELSRIVCADDVLSRYVRSRWATAIEDVGNLAKGAVPHAIYPRNTDLWRSLVALTLQFGAQAGAPSAWRFYIEALPRDASRPRNAAPATTTDSFVVDFAGAASWDDAARVVRDELAKRRGEDLVEGDLIRRVPRTTNEDVVQLAEYWDRLLSRAGTHHRDISSRRVLERWRTAIADVAQLTKGAEPRAVYPRNLDFWRALMTISIQIAATKEAPTRLTLVTEAARHGVRALPETLSDAATWLGHKVAEAPAKLAAGLRDAIVKPLLIAAGGVIGVVLLLRAVRDDRRRDRGDRSNP